MVKCLLKTLPVNFYFFMDKAITKKKSKVKVRYFFLAGILFVFFGVFLGFFSLGSFLTPQDKLEKSDVIVVISGGDTTERTAEGVKLFKDGYAPFILFSGAARSGDVSNAKTMQRYAVRQGVPQGKIIIEEESTSTYENALFTKPILEKNNFKKIILVTSSYHQRRAYMNFTYVLGKDYKILNHSSRDDTWRESEWWQHKESINITLEEFSRIVYLAVTKNYQKQAR